MSNNIPEDWKGRAEKAELEADHQRRCAVEWFDKFHASERLTSQLRGEVERAYITMIDTAGFLRGYGNAAEIAADKLIEAVPEDFDEREEAARAALEVKP